MVGEYLSVYPIIRYVNHRSFSQSIFFNFPATTQPLRVKAPGATASRDKRLSLLPRGARPGTPQDIPELGPLKGCLLDVYLC
jgi:hypothetical protein